MASIKFGNIVVDMRGSISGNVYAKNKGGAYSRVKVKPANPKTVAQQAVRAVFTSLSQAWKGLTATQRLSWNQGASNFPVKNRLGESINLSGNALYVALNKNLADVAIAAIASCPSPASVNSVAVSTAVADTTAQTLVITLGAVVPANTSLKIFASETLSAGVNSVGSKLRQISYASNGDAAALDLTTEYLAKFGAIGAAGSNVFYEIVPVNETTGQTGAAISGKIVITA